MSQKLSTGTPSEQRSLNFSLEDTHEGSYRDITADLLHRGWKKVSYTSRRTKLEKRRLTVKQMPRLIWTLQDKDIEYSELHPTQLVNHFEGIGCITTKRGFCELMREPMTFAGKERYSLSPRAYNLGDPLHREEFIEDFRIMACINIVKWALLVIGRHGCLALKAKQQSRRQHLRDQMDSWLRNVSGSGSENASVCTSSCTSPRPEESSVVGEDDKEGEALQYLEESGVSLPLALLRLSLQALTNYLRVHSAGDWPGVGSQKADSPLRTKLSFLQRKAMPNPLRKQAVPLPPSSAPTLSKQFSAEAVAIPAELANGYITASVKNNKNEKDRLGLLRSTMRFNTSVYRKAAGMSARPLYGSGGLVNSLFVCEEADVAVTGSDAASASISSGGGGSDDGTVRVQTNIAGVSEVEWSQLLAVSYAIAEAASHSSPSTLTNNSSNGKSSNRRDDAATTASGSGQWDALIGMSEIYSEDIDMLLSVLGKGRDSVALQKQEQEQDRRVVSTNFSVLQSHTPPKRKGIANLYASPLHWRLLLVLRGCAKLPQLQYDLSSGFRNVWVVKAPDASCGLGLRLLYRLSDVLEAERGMGGRTCQKYVENPLLYVPAPVSLSPLPTPFLTKGSVGSFISGVDVTDIPDITVPRPLTNPAPEQRIGGGDCTAHPFSSLTPARKFDLRVWVLVTSFFPLRAYVYSTVYGRACGVGYSLQVGDAGGSNLLDPLTHFTNYSVQSKVQMYSQGDMTGMGISVNSEDCAIDIKGKERDRDREASGRVKSLRGTVDSFRDDAASDSPSLFTAVPVRVTSAEERLGDLLIPHRDVVMAVEAAGGAGRWETTWKQLKTQILNSLLATRMQLPLGGTGDTPIAKQLHSAAFEFLGYDVIFDKHTLSPLILEVNLSPAMARRNAKHAAVIKHMCSGLVELAILPHLASSSLPFSTACSASSSLALPTAHSRTSLEYRQEQSIVTPDYSLCGQHGSDTKASDSDIPTANKGIKSTEMCGEWEPLHRVDDIYESGGNLGNLPIPLTVRAPVAPPVNDWSDLRPSSKSRPSSAGFRGHNSVGTGLGPGSMVGTSNTGGSTVDICFTLQGKAISPGCVAHIDRITGRFDKLLLLQKWARRYCLDRSRLWHHTRQQASHLLQAAARRFLFQCRVLHRVDRAACVKIQCVARKWQASRLVHRLRCLRASEAIQRSWLCHVARHVYRRRLLHVSSSTIQHWYRRVTGGWKRKHAFKIVMCVRCWLSRRHQARRVLRHLFKLNVLRRKRQRATVVSFLVRIMRSAESLRNVRVQQAYDLSVRAAAAARDRLLRQMEQSRLKEEQHERCLIQVVEILITEDLFDVTIKDMWAAAFTGISPVDVKAHNQCNESSVSSSIGHTLAVVARMCLQEAKAEEDRHRRLEQEMELAIAQEQILRQGTNAGLVGSARSGLSAHTQRLLTATNTSVQEHAQRQRQRRLSLGEITRSVLERARVVLSSTEYLAYKIHLFAMQDAVYSNDSDQNRKSVNSIPTNLSLPEQLEAQLPVTLPADRLAEYRELVEKIRLAGEVEQQEQLMLSAHQGEVVVFNGRVITTNNFRNNMHSQKDEKVKGANSSRLYPYGIVEADEVGGTLLPYQGREQKQEQDHGSYAVRGGLNNLFVDTADPAQTDATTVRPPLPLSQAQAPLQQRPQSAQRTRVQRFDLEVAGQPFPRQQQLQDFSSSRVRSGSAVWEDTPILSKVSTKKLKAKKRPSSAGPRGRLSSRSHAEAFSDVVPQSMSPASRYTSLRSAREIERERGTDGFVLEPELQQLPVPEIDTESRSRPRSSSNGSGSGRCGSGGGGGGWSHWTEPAALSLEEKTKGNAHHVSLKFLRQGQGPRHRHGNRQEISLSSANTGAWDGFMMMADFGEEICVGSELRGMNRGGKSKSPMRGSRSHSRSKSSSSSQKKNGRSASRERERWKEAGVDVDFDDNRAIEADRSRMLTAMLAGLGFNT